MAYNNAALCCNSHVQEYMLSSNRLLQYKTKPQLGFQNLRCHCKILGCQFDTQKRLKKHWCKTHMSLPIYLCILSLINSVLDYFHSRSPFDFFFLLDPKQTHSCFSLHAVKRVQKTSFPIGNNLISIRSFSRVG